MPERSALNASVRDIPQPPGVDQLTIDGRGFPVPWFVDCGPNGDEPDHRAIDGRKFRRGVREGRCWVCGGKLGRVKASVIGPMCAINRLTSEPPCHPPCARYAVQACPFLSRPRARRNAKDMPEEACQPAGIYLDRNPGVAVIWESLQASKPFDPPRGNPGVLFDLGSLYRVSWWCEGRPATYEEAVASIASGLPALLATAQQDGEAAVLELAEKTAKAADLLPPKGAGMSIAVPLTDQIKCAKRELAMRERVYASWVRKQRMTRETASHELAAMRAIVASLEALHSVQAVWL